MVEWGRERPPGKGGAPAAAGVAGADDRRRAAVLPAWNLPRLGALLGSSLRQRIGAWAEAEGGPGRLLPWLPIAFGAGIALYFTAEHEPLVWAGPTLAAICGLIACLARRRALGFGAALIATAAALGFSVASLKATRLAHPVLQAPAWNVEVSGFIERLEMRERSDRIVVLATRVEAPRLGVKPERVRVTLRKGTPLAVGQHVTFKARLGPPPAPLRPGGYDFARDLYFQRIGATGFVLGAVTVSQPQQAREITAGMRAAAAIESLREAIDRRIKQAVPGDAGAIASALITGKRDAIGAHINEAMYVSSLAHVLSISGYHMAVVAGVVFFALRAALALVPGFASRRPIKKWAAVGALAGAAFYLAISGGAIATQRAFIMTSVVLIGVIADRPALTLRTLAFAALAVLTIAPEALVHPSFQMSFAATLALVAAYENSAGWRASADSSLAARVALWGGREVAALVLASVVAGLATMPYAAYHFHRIAPYGVLANLVAMPIVSAWVMPSGLLALLLMPFGFDGLLWRLMGEGISWMVAAAIWVASLPGANLRMPAFGAGPLLLCTIGMAILCILRTPLRHAGTLLAVTACVLAWRAPQPDVLVAGDGRSIAVRGSDGRLSVHRSPGGDAFAVRTWLAADGDDRAPDDASLRGGMRCDDNGCIGRAPSGQAVALALRPEAFEEDCRIAAVVIVAREAPPWCQALVVDRTQLRAQGAAAIRFREGGPELEFARPQGLLRPWTRQPERSQTPTAAASTTGPSATSPRTNVPTPLRSRPLRNSTPRTEDLEPGD